MKKIWKSKRASNRKLGLKELTKFGSCVEKTRLTMDLDKLENKRFVFSLSNDVLFILPKAELRSCIAKEDTSLMIYTLTPNF